MVELLNLVCLDVVFETAFVILTYEIAVSSVEEYQVIDVVRRKWLRILVILIIWLESISNLTD